MAMSRRSGSCRSPARIGVATFILLQSGVFMRSGIAWVRPQRQAMESVGVSFGMAPIGGKRVLVPSRWSALRTAGFATSNAITSAAPNVAVEGSELLMEPYHFDAKELRWMPTSEAAAKICLRKQSGENWKLEMGNQVCSLAEVRSVSLLGPNFVVLEIVSKGQVGLRSNDEVGIKNFVDALSRRKADYERFEQYDQESVQSYFQYYAKISKQQNMLKDEPRTSTYRRAILENSGDFQGKRALDLGAGSGILSFFAVQAGADKVYAVEASSMGEVVRLLADANEFLTEKIEVVNKPVEAITTEVDGKVDVLVSEPIGTFLFNERMIESYLYARDRFLKPGGKMFPNAGTLCIAPFSDGILHWEQSNKNNFWKNSNFYGIDLNAAGERCFKETFRQPIVDFIDPGCVVSECVRKRFDFTTISVESLQEIEIPFNFEISQSCSIHGLAGWFDIHFDGSNQTVLLSTAPGSPGTHWYQTRFLLEKPLDVKAGQHIEGSLRMNANDLQSYYVKLTMRIMESGISAEAPCVDLKDPEYRSYSFSQTDALFVLSAGLVLGLWLGLFIARVLFSSHQPPNV